MADRATPNLPSSDFARTVEFYGRVGFTTAWRDEGWLILERGTTTLEFFSWPDVDPLTTSFSACLRLDDLDDFFAVCRAAGLPESHVGHPRLHAPVVEEWGGRVGALIDPDGTLLRLIQN